ncbi:CLUMA_CG004705, isoform A, partial [Clunio marinus]
MIQKFLILMIVGYSSILMVKSELHVDCNFRNQEIWNYNVYTCEASISKFGSGNQVTRVTGNHLSGKNDDDVQAISILDQNLEE